MASKTPMRARGDLIDPNAMSFGEHLEDLRRRVILAIAGIVPIFVVGLIFGRSILEVLIQPVQRALREAGLPAVLQATSPLEGFSAYVRVAVVLTLVVGSPWMLYQLWRFVAPGLYAAEKRFVHVLIPLSAALSVVGVVFLYFVILPVVLAFFIGFSSQIGRSEAQTVEPPAGTVFPTIPVLAGDPPAPEVGAEWINESLMQRRVCVGYEGTVPTILGSVLTRGSGIVQQYRISEYVKLVMSLGVAFAVGFQTPVVVLLLGWAGLVDRPLLARMRKQTALICAAASAFLTPADPLSMVLLAVPLYLLYELGGLLLWIMPASKLAGERFKDEDLNEMVDDDDADEAR